MNDLIRRQDAIDLFPNDALEWDTKGAYIAPHLARQMIEELPSTEPEIIYCKDCKHYEFADNRAFGFPVRRCEWTGFEDIDENDFCSRAERQEE